VGQDQEVWLVDMIKWHFKEWCMKYCSYWQFPGDQKEWTIMRGKRYLWECDGEMFYCTYFCHLFLILQRQNTNSKAPWMCCSHIFPRLNWVLDNNSTHLVINVVIFKIFSFGLYIASSVIVLQFEALCEVHFWNSAVVSFSFNELYR